MAIEIINARSDPKPGGIRGTQQSTRYIKSARTEHQQNSFFEAYISEGTITHAAKKVGISPKRHYEWLETDASYPARFKEAHRASVEALEREARRRAIEGTEEPTGWYKGEPGGFVKRYSDVLLIFLLKGALPEKYKDHISATIDINTSPLPLDKLPMAAKCLLVSLLSGNPMSEGLEKMIMAECGSIVENLASTTSIETQIDTRQDISPEYEIKQISDGLEIEEFYAVGVESEIMEVRA